MKKEDTQQIIGVLVEASEFDLAIDLTREIVKGEIYKVLTRSPLSDVPEPITREDTPEGYEKKKRRENNRYHIMPSLKKKEKVDNTRQRREKERKRIKEQQEGVSSIFGNYM